MGGFNQDRPGVQLLTSIARGGAVTFFSPFTNLAVNRARPHDTGLLLVKRTLTILTAPLWEDRTSTGTHLKTRTTCSITGCPSSPISKYAINGARNDLASTLLLQYFCTLNPTMQGLLDD
jgi:hypothetical protein